MASYTIRPVGQMGTRNTLTGVYKRDDTARRYLLLRLARHDHLPAGAYDLYRDLEHIGHLYKRV